LEDIPEVDWKRRFAITLCARFILKGLPHEDAVEDAKAHADDRYPKRSNLDPEAAAEQFFLSLVVV
jgi:hypothetical protein